MKRWMGPANFTCPEVEIDFRVGGSYRAMITSPAHGENWFGGVYREIVENKRLVFTFTWDNDGPSAGVETLVTITFEEKGGKTVQTFHQRPFLNVERRDSHVGGLTSAFDKLAAYATPIAKEHTARLRSRHSQGSQNALTSKCAIWARAGPWRRRASLTGRGFCSMAIRTSRTIASCSPSGRCRFFKTAISRSSNPERSCSISAS